MLNLSLPWSQLFRYFWARLWGVMVGSRPPPPPPDVRVVA